MDYTTMDIYSPPGSKVIFQCIHGTEWCQEDAKNHLKVGEIYTVKRTEVGQSNTSVYLAEFPDRGFNSVLFINAPHNYTKLNLGEK